MTLSLYLARQDAQLVSAFNNPAHYPVGISHPDAFPSFLKSGHKIEFDPRVRKQHAFTRHISQTNEIEYWVHIDYRSYRTAFKRFLTSRENVPETEITAEWQADHLLSQAYARKFGVDYVRMCLLHKGQNQDYGRKFERNMISIQQESRSIFLLDYLYAMKGLGIPIPKNQADYEVRKADIAQALMAKGVNFPDRRGPEFELDAYFNWWDVI
jgi:hypothetical protein